jgi:hypothetical protein
MQAIVVMLAKEVSKTIWVTDQPEWYRAGRSLSVAVIADISTNRFPRAL